MYSESDNQPVKLCVFVSYRREDSSSSAGRLYDAMSVEFGANCVFKDVDSIGAGENFETVLVEALKESTVVLALIGPRWEGQRGYLRRPRIWDESDWVRKELELARDAAVSVLPVFVDGARPLRQENLPASIQYLAALHAPSLRNDRWGDDVKALLREIRTAHKRLEDSPTTVLQERQSVPVVMSHWTGTKRLVRLSVTIVIAGIAVVFLVTKLGNDNFKNIDGFYKGTAEGYEFRFCVERQSNRHVIGSIYFPSSPETTKVFLDGQIEEDSIEFQYHRYSSHPRGPDSGKAVLTLSDEPGQYRGYWASDSKPDNRERWVLEKLNEECAFSGWVGELGSGA